MHGPSPERVVVIGAGIGGLAAAIRLAAAGLSVTVVERAPSSGGKMREVTVAGRPVDFGPTVLTWRAVLDDLFAAAGERLEDHLTLVPAEVLTRHAWADGRRLDLFADRARSADAIAAFAGPEAGRDYLDFAIAAERMFQTLKAAYLERTQTTALGLTWRLGLHRLPDLRALKPFSTLWAELGRRFRDPCLRQLFARYATYAGCSPFRAPATLMLIAHVEAMGVWLPGGGMQSVARALEGLARRQGARFLMGDAAIHIEVETGRVAAVRLESGLRLPADHVVAAVDPSAIASGSLGPEVRRAVDPLPAGARSLSALTLSLVARARGFPLVRHNVFFADDYACEFRDLHHGRLPRQPTLYVCAQDRGASLHEAGPELERFLVIVNAPALADVALPGQEEIERCVRKSLDRLAALGLELTPEPQGLVVTTPADFARLFPGSGGAIYGRAAHGPTGSFRRPGARSRLAGLYLAGGGVHPGAGVPMVALSGRLAAEALMADRASQRRFHPVAISGGTSTPSAPTAASA